MYTSISHLVVGNFALSTATGSTLSKLDKTVCVGLLDTILHQNRKVSQLLTKIQKY